MNINDKLNSLTSMNTVTELGEMLKHAKVSINWYGQRIVSIEGYEGSVEVNAIALKYLCASPFNSHENPSLNERLDCYNLWGRVQQLYIESANELDKTWIYKYMTSIIEFRPYCRACAGDPIAVLGEWDFGTKKESIFAFKQEEFKKWWPQAIPLGVSYSIRTHDERWFANKEMVEAALT